MAATLFLVETNPMVAALTVDRNMAKKTGRPRKPTGEGAPVRIDRDLVTMARTLAGYQGSALSEYLSNLLRPVITREYRTMVKALEAEAGEK
jgi:hypothetical protein